MALSLAGRLRWRLAITLALVLTFGIGSALPAAAFAAAPGRYIVVLKDGTDIDQAIQNLDIQHGLTTGHVYRNALRGFAATIPAALVAALRNDPRVAFIEPDLKVTTTAEYRTGVDRVDAELHPLYGLNKAVDVDIAVLDTGIDPSHPDLNVVGGVSFVPGVASYADDHGHGSHVAGIAAAKYDGRGIAGVAPGARLWAVKVLGASGSGNMSDIIKGVDWVTQRASTIEVVNLSLGAVGRSDALRAAIQRSVAAGVVYVVAAGNSARDIYGPDGVFGTADDFIPAAYPEVMTVSALADSDGRPGGTGSGTSAGPDDTMATFSNYSRAVVSGNPVTSAGRAVDVAAPGVSIYSTWMRGGYNTASGTSMAAPHAAGVVALHMAANNLRPTTAAGVYAIRQAIVDAGQPQSQWRADGNTRDPDGYREPMAYVRQSATQPPPPPPPPPPAPTTGVSVSPASQTGQTAAGTSVSYSYTVKNTGSTSASFTATVSAAWSAVASPTSLTLASGASGVVKVTHTAPASAAPGASSSGSLTVSGAGASASATFATTVPAASAGLTVKTVINGSPRPGGFVDFSVTVTDSAGKPVPSAQVAITMRTSARTYSGTKTTNLYGVVRTWVWSSTTDGFPWTITASASKNGLTGTSTITYPTP